MEKTTDELLIIFYRNPQIGKVKTRLAATLGDQRALEVFTQLSLHIERITENLNIDKVVFYSEAVAHYDIWPERVYMKEVQSGADLGERMEEAFTKGFRKGYSAVCIIGTDCYELTSDIIRDSFELLKNADAVIGPARDGGYYLLGTKALFPELFRNKRWSTDTVLRDTIADFKRLQLKYTTLQVLRDVDTEDDLPPSFKV